MTETNDSSVDQDSSEESVIHDPDFARPLRQAREQAGLSVEQVASQLLLAVDIINAIENADMQRLPSSTFVVGYIRSYAKILNVPADEVIEAYNALIPPPTENVATQSPFAEAETVKSNNSSLLIYIVIAIVIAALAWWFVNQPNDIEKPADTSQTTEFSSQPESLTNDATPEEFSTLTNTDETSPADDSALNTQDSEQSSVPETELQDEGSQTDQLEGLSAPLFDALILTGVDESWAEVVDANGDRLFYQLINNGEEIKLSGQAPFEVFLGNAPAIRIEVNNTLVEFDHLISSSKNVASITIAADASVTRTKNR
jgi:cytoskeleton protein RodZ